MLNCLSCNVTTALVQTVKNHYIKHFNEATSKSKENAWNLYFGVMVWQAYTPMYRVSSRKLPIW